MPFELRESVGGIRHLVRAAQRKLLQFDAEHYVRDFSAQGLHCAVLKDERGNPVYCQICGFAVATVDLPHGWSLETCSSVGLSDIRAKSAHFQEWLRHLPAISAEEKSKTVPEPICQMRSEEHIH